MLSLQAFYFGADEVGGGQVLAIHNNSKLQKNK